MDMFRVQPLDFQLASEPLIESVTHNFRKSLAYELPILRHLRTASFSTSHWNWMGLSGYIFWGWHLKALEPFGFLDPAVMPSQPVGLAAAWDRLAHRSGSRSDVSRELELGGMGPFCPSGWLLLLFLLWSFCGCDDVLVACQWRLLRLFFHNNWISSRVTSSTCQE